MQRTARRGPARPRTPNPEGRSARKRRQIMEAATALFLRHGYPGTSMDDVAAKAAVSKQTVYKHFADKESLFTDIVLGITARAAELVETMTPLLDSTEDLEKDLHDFGRMHIASVMRPEVIQLRRLVIGEAGRFPDLARAYWEQAPGRVIDALAASLSRLAERGLLKVDDPGLAAHHLAWLILSAPLERAMFKGDEKSYTAAELNRLADAGVAVFLDSYRP